MDDEEQTRRLLSEAEATNVGACSDHLRLSFGPNVAAGTRVAEIGNGLLTAWEFLQCIWRRASVYGRQSCRDHFGHQTWDSVATASNI